MGVEEESVGSAHGDLVDDPHGPLSPLGIGLDPRLQRQPLAESAIGQFLQNGRPLGHLAVDACWMGGGFFLALVTLGGAREILGSGSLFGVALFGDGFEPWVVMLLPPGGFLMLGIILLIFATVKEAREKRSAPAERRAA